jgi:ABC-type multidrug transport system fused ATPase/permease subunit
MNYQYRSQDLEQSISKYNTVFSVLITISMVVAAASIYFAATLNPSFALGLLLLAPLLIVVFYFSGKRRNLRYLQQIRKDWNKTQVAKEREFKTIRSLYDYSFRSEKENQWIDDQTWKDLNMDQLYNRIDRTLTDPGESVLYEILRKPLSNKEALKERCRIIRLFQNDLKSREKIQMELLRLGHQFVRNDLFNLLWRNELPHTKLSPLFLVMAVGAFISLFIPLIFWSGILILIPISMFIINLLTHYYIKRKIDLETISFPYLIRCIKTAKTLSKIQNEELQPYTNRLRELYKTSKGIVTRSFFLFPANQSLTDPATGFILEYGNIFFLLEINAFYATSGELSRHIRELRELYLTLGELDTYQSIASYRASLTSYSEPEFLDGGLCLEIKEARQPLLENPVAASIQFNKNVVIITGSNMGGKSTFLRNIGNNVLMAQTIGTTLSSYYHASFFRIVTSISRTDDLMAGKSFYFVEAERILRIIQSFDHKLPTLCIIDELLSGTNSFERLRASESIIRYLAGQNDLAIIATHDLELAERLKGLCDFYHFTDNVNENGLIFDYQLKSGIATTRNAIALLKYLGYPKEIIENTN